MSRSLRRNRGSLTERLVNYFCGRRRGAAASVSGPRPGDELGLDMTRLRADMESPEVAGLIAANRRLAGRLGVSGTPAFLFLGPELVGVSPGALDASGMADLIASVQSRRRVGAG